MCSIGCFPVFHLKPSSSSAPMKKAKRGEQRDLWMAAISIASAHKPLEAVAGVLRITLLEGGIAQDNCSLDIFVFPCLTGQLVCSNSAIWFFFPSRSPI